MPGNGKTLYAVDWLIRQAEVDAKAVKGGAVPRAFYTDIEGFDFEAVEKLTGYRVQPAPDDWRETPKGSVIVYDEAHRRFPSTGKPGRSEDARVRDLDTHRHGGYDLLFITQWPSKVHHELRQLVGEHVHLNRAMGLESAGLFRWPRVQADPYDERQREKAEEEIWRFPKDRYPLYTSSTLHTASHKFKFPKKFWAGVSTVVVMLLVFWALWAVLVKPDEKNNDSAQVETGARPSALALAAPAPSSGPLSLTPGMGSYSSISTEPVPTLAGCVASETRCRCYAADGFQIDMSVQQCRALLSEPLPFNVYHAYVQPVMTARAGAVDKDKPLAGTVVAGDSSVVTGAGIRASDLAR